MGRGNLDMLLLRNKGSYQSGRLPIDSLTTTRYRKTSIGRSGGDAFFQLKFTPTSRVVRWLAVHDEIQASPGPEGHPFLVHGILFIPWERREYVFRKLQELRHGHQSRIEYREIEAQRGPKFEVAKRWLDWFKNEGVGFCTFKVFAVDQESFGRFPYRGDPDWPFHIMQNTLTSFVAGITWSLGRPNGILLDIVCDSSGDEGFLAALDELPRRLKLDFRQRRLAQRQRMQDARSRGESRRSKLFPMVRVHGKVRLHSSNPLKATPGYEDETEFIQLTDVILGSLWDAIQARKVDERGKAGRIRLRREWLELYRSQSGPEWGQRLPYYRRVSVSIYPDENRRAYPATVLAEPRGQLAFPIYHAYYETRKERRRRQRSFHIPAIA